MADAFSKYVNTTQVAKALDLSVSTVKRWVDDGILPALKTPGGHRKILLADVMELVRRGDLPCADLSLLVKGGGSNPKSEVAAATRLSDRLYHGLHSGDLDQVRVLIHGAYRGGASIEDLADQTIGPAMERIGQDWEEGKIDVMEEHRASQMCVAALYELKAVIEKRAGRNRPKAVGGAAPDDSAIIPSLLAQMVLIDAGWNAINLGPNTPYYSFTRAIRDLRPRLMWLSVCHLLDEELLLAGYRDLYQVAEKAQVAVAIGGRALTDSLRARMPYTTHGDGLTHLAAFARTLHPRPRPPRRGRPPKK